MNTMELFHYNVIKSLENQLKETVAVFLERKQWLKANGFNREIEHYENKIVELQNSITEEIKAMEWSKLHFGKKSA